MKTAFITLQIALNPQPADLQPQIETVLQEHGIPLRWAITRIDNQTQPPTAHIEAIVTTD